MHHFFTFSFQERVIDAFDFLPSQRRELINVAKKPTYVIRASA